MNQQDQQSSEKLDRCESRARFWKETVPPLAKGIEAFFWRIAWFTVFVFVLRMLLTQ